MKKLATILLVLSMAGTLSAQNDIALRQKSDSLFAKGVELYKSRKYKNAIPFFDQSYSIDTTLYGINTPYRNYSCHWEANCYYKIGDIDQAKKIYENYFVEPVDRRLTVDIDSLIMQSNSYNEGNNIVKAIECKRKALDLIKLRLGENVKYANNLTNLGLLYYTTGNVNDAISSFEEALKINSSLLGNNHKDCYVLVNNLGIIYYYMGKYQNALEYFKRRYEIAVELYGDESIETMKLLSDIALVMSYVGEMDNSLAIYKKLEKLCENKKSKEFVSLYKLVLNNIGAIYQDLESCDKAIEYYEKSLPISKELYGEKSADYATALDNIGNIYFIMGSFEKSLEYHNNAIDIFENNSIADSVSYARYLSNTGTVYEKIKQYDKAFDYYKRALEIRIKKLGNHPDVASTLINLGNVDTANRIQYYLEAKDILEQTSGKNSIVYLLCISNIAKEERSRHNYKEAIAIFESILDIVLSNYGEKNYQYISTLKELGYCKMFSNEFDEGASYYQKAMSISKNTLISNFSFMTAAERSNYWKFYNGIYSDVLIVNNFIPNNNIQSQFSYDAELITKGLLLTSEIEFNKLIAESNDGKLIAEFENMRLLRLDLNKELEKPLDERIYNCDSLEKEIQKMERHLVENCRQYGDFTRSIAINWKDVQNSLKSNDVAIEFANFNENDKVKYAAIVLTKAMESPVFVPLFYDSDIAGLLRGIAPAKPDAPNDDDRGASTVSSKRHGIYESTGLYRLVWQPLEKYFPENPRIYFAPSGTLHQIAVEYAPVDNDKTISDKYEIYRVSSTRFLAMDYMPRPLKNSVLYGGIFYDSDTTTMKRESDRYTTRSAISYTSFADFNRNEDRGSLNYLPGTKTEVENIVGTLKKKKKVKATLYEGSSANEESFKALSGKDINVLHIATHGFFLPTDEKMSGDQSLVQSGLLLSGANYAWQNKPLPEGIEDGILTAKEISYMDLRKTDLVVLSACQTALGEITGEGVFGLQRGFKKAGARTIIMSLWPVDDNATLLMMSEFYTNLTNGLSKREAFLAAQNKVKTTAGFENPRYWAAFIMLDGNEK